MDGLGMSPFGGPVNTEVFHALRPRERGGPEQNVKRDTSGQR
mgnify:CR=1 FL=1|jgi:hypothetical protein